MFVPEENYDDEEEKLAEDEAVLLGFFSSEIVEGVYGLRVDIFKSKYSLKE